ncbi:hypothetical protein Micbo1qcDRAFT_208436 [Microdochium bolleyi]|uniref:Uncharacterized protein n=1 Tax=Microdochium bolleyi TaxID=196109 RepID=A0A136IQ33_9PEZI|nr:hypothetical protein Micbo1qcDRAFT_208436 [Microdochium bolleyi]
MPVSASTLSAEAAAGLLIDRGADLLFGPGPGGQHCHALHVASHQGCSEIVRYLCGMMGEHGPVIDVDIEDAYGRTPTAQALLGQSPNRPFVISTLIRAGANVNATVGPDGFTLLHLACWAGKWLEAVLLFRSGAELDVVCHNTDSRWDLPSGPIRPIDLVCTNTSSSAPSRDRKQILIDHGRVLASETRVDLLKHMIRWGASTATCPGLDRSPMTIAAAFPDPSTALALLSTLRDAGLRPDHDDDLSTIAAVQLASTQYRVPVISWLLGNGARIPYSGQRAETFFSSIQTQLDSLHCWPREAPELLRVYIDEGGHDPDLRGPDDDFLVLAFLRGRCFNLVDVLLAAGANSPDVSEVLRDFRDKLPVLETWERHSVTMGVRFTAHNGDFNAYSDDADSWVGDAVTCLTDPDTKFV